MRNKYILFCFLGIFGRSTLNAQNQIPLKIQDAIEMALQNSDDAKIANAKLAMAENSLKVTKNLQYPDAKMSGQYTYLSDVSMDLKINTDANNAQDANAPLPSVHQLMLGQANISMPVFMGFRLKNTVEAAENQYKAASYDAKNESENIAIRVVREYINLYKANQTILLIRDNLKSAKQRVDDFSAMEKNGLLARNDLLKAQLQESNLEVSLQEAEKTESILNYRLAVLLKLPENTTIEAESMDFGAFQIDTDPSVNIHRNDLEALQYHRLAANNEIKIAHSKYYPSIALSGGFVAMDLQNVVTVKSAMNIGVGVSYNISDIFKTKSEIKLAESKAEELKYTIDALSDKVKVEVENAKQDYQLAISKYDVYTKSEEQAMENYRIVKDKYDNGLLDTNDLLEADVGQLQAKIDLAYARADIAQKYYELLSAQGQLTSTLDNL